ncbi:small ubiquitin-related modifier 3 isoform X1 [Physeter macrocephalus]|uniref:Small ubiquitin-related modifier 3 isoform X1 n=1 Tax=Physeter macrocephalus TaxID=9755 RepID=A0A9W2WT43_PHYMC|nr:small ubiquitin-related modifier 3 isoform X1 [Physeter catodon]
MSEEKPKEGVKTENDHINLKVAGQDGSVVQFKIKRHTPLSKLMKAYCERQGLSMRQIRFRFDGQPISETDTPAQVGEPAPPVLEGFFRPACHNRHVECLHLRVTHCFSPRKNTLHFLSFFFFLAAPGGLRDPSSPNLGPRQRKCRILTTGPPGNTHLTFYFLYLSKKFFFFLAVLCGMWGLSSPTRDRTCDPCSGSVES